MIFDYLGSGNTDKDCTYTCCPTVITILVSIMMYRTLTHEPRYISHSEGTASLDPFCMNINYLEIVVPSQNELYVTVDVTVICCLTNDC